MVLKEFFTKLFAIYFLRWQFSGIVMIPFMLVFDYYSTPLWLNILLGQAVGSFIFFFLDKWIFKNN